MGARMVVDEDRGVLLGVTIVGSDVAELLQAARIAIVGEVPLYRLWYAAPVYPTISEVRLLEAYGRPTAPVMHEGRFAIALDREVLGDEI